MPTQIEVGEPLTLADLLIDPKVRQNRWAVILAGGDGTRVRQFTRVLAGDSRPKQFCAFVGGETLLDRTRNRVAGLLPEHRISIAVTRKHRGFFGKDLLNSRSLVIIQPENRGTGPAILYSLMSIRRRDPSANVAIFPSSHYFSDESRFLECVDAAFGVVERRKDLSVVLGMVPDSPATDYRWIEPSNALPGLSSEQLFEIYRFYDGPTLQLAERMLTRGWLWNSAVVIGSVDSLLGMYEVAAPVSYRSFRAAIFDPGGDPVVTSVEAVYRDLEVVDFCGDILTACPEALSVLQVDNSGWSDLQNEKRILALVARTRTRTGSAND